MIALLLRPGQSGIVRSFLLNRSITSFNNIREQKIKLNGFVAMLLTAAVWVPQLQAQGYPNKPIRVVIGYAPGGSADAGARPLARVLETFLGKPMVIEYRP